MNINYKNYLPLASAILVAAVFGASFMMFFFSIQSKNDDISALTASVADETKKADEIALLKKTIASTEADSAALGSHFISQDHVIDFLGVLDAYGKNSGTVFALDSVGIDPDTQALDVSMHATGAFSDMYQLLKMLENSPYDLSIDKASLAHSSDPTKLREWDAQFTIELISYVPAK